MGRETMEVTTLHGYTIEELLNLKNNTESKYTRLALTAITMRYSGYSNTEIMESTGLSSVSIQKPIKNWNSIGLKSIENHRGGKKPSKLTPDIVDDLIYVTLHKTPVDFEFIGHTWTCALLALYVNQTYGVEVSGVTIWNILKSNNLSYKRAQAKPTKAEQEALKKTLETLESSYDAAVYALDETGICIEWDNHSSRSPIGSAPILEKNGSHKRINVASSTCILNAFPTVNDVYSCAKSITSEEIKSHLNYLLEINPDKRVVVFLDNAKTHTSVAMQAFYLEKKKQLQLIFLPRYSPYMNPQENIWNHLKAKLFRPSSRLSIEELISDVKDIFDELNSNVDKIHSLANARSFLV